MNFRTWLEATLKQVRPRTSRVEWDFALTLPSLGIRGATSEPVLLNQGSHADIYLNPVDPSTLIKVTNDRADVKNTLSAQKLNSPNIVKCYAHTNSGVKGGTALLVDYVKGKRAPYTTAEFLGLMEGKLGTNPRNQADARILNPDPFRLSILNRHQRLSEAELNKLSELFHTIFLLEQRLNIFLADLSENIIDAAHSYVIIDLGR